jgi:flagellar biosynthesis component FlhA
MIRSVDNLPSLLRGLSQNGLLLALLGLAILLVLPLPTPLLSLLLVADLLLSALVLSALVRARSAAQVTTLPTLLLLGALFRLALNIASSRLILTRGDAGVVVESVGRLLTDGSWAVGLLLYAMVSLVQWMVINQGSARVAEVAARFALDALPVRMLAIDQEAKAGRLDTAELDRRRTALLDEAKPGRPKMPRIGSTFSAASSGSTSASVLPSASARGWAKKLAISRSWWWPSG